MRGSLAQKCILRAGLPRGLPLPPGEVKAPSVCGLGCPCHPDPWTSTSSARPSRGCCRVWMAPGGIGCTLAPAPTWPCWAGTTSAVSVGLVGGRGVPLHPSTRAPPLPSFLAPPTHKTAWVSTTVPTSPHRACGGAASAGTARLPEALLTLPLLSPPWPLQPPTSPCVPCPAAPALTPHRSGSSGCPSPSPSSVSVPEGADAPSRDGPWRPPFFVLPASPCTGGEAVAPAAAYEQRPWWPWVRSTVPTGPLSKTGTGPGATGCLSWCVWT